MLQLWSPVCGEELRHGELRRVELRRGELRRGELRRGECRPSQGIVYPALPLTSATAPALKGTP